MFDVNKVLIWNVLSLEFDNVSGEVDCMLITYDEDERMIGHKGLGIQWQRHGHTSGIWEWQVLELVEKEKSGKWSETYN